MIKINEMRQIPCLDLCTNEELLTLVPRFKQKTVQKGNPVYCEGESSDFLYIIRSGRVEMTKYLDEEERFSHLGFLRQGDIIGIGEMYFDEYYISVTAREKTFLYMLCKQDFFRCFINIKALHDFVTITFAKIIRQQQFKQDYWYSAEKKLSYYLYFLCNEGGTVNGAWIHIKKKLTHESMAQVLNMSREQVTRLINQFKKRGILTKSGRGLSVSMHWYESKKSDQRYNISFRRYFNDGSF